MCDVEIERGAWYFVAMIKIPKASLERKEVDLHHCFGGSWCSWLSQLWWWFVGHGRWQHNDRGVYDSNSMCGCGPRKPCPFLTNYLCRDRKGFPKNHFSLIHREDCQWSNHLSEGTTSQSLCCLSHHHAGTDFQLMKCQWTERNHRQTTAYTFVPWQHHMTVSLSALARSFVRRKLFKLGENMNLN